MRTPDDHQTLPMADAKSSRPRGGQQYVGVSNSIIGKALAGALPPSDGKRRSGEASKSRIYLIHEIFLKALMESRTQRTTGAGHGFAANKAHQKKHGVTDWEYRQTRRAAKRVMGNFGRKQVGRGYATEDPLPKSGDGEVRLPVWAVETLDKKILAFAVAVLIRIKPCRPSEAAQTIGLCDDEVIARLVREAVQSELIERHKGVRGKVFVGRPGANFPECGNTPINHHPENHHPGKCPAHSNCTEGSPTDSKNTILDTTRRSASERAPYSSVRETLKNWRLPHSEPDAWRHWGAFRREEFSYPTDSERLSAPFSVWLEHVQRRGPAPEHLTSTHAYAQAIDIARELIHRLWNEPDESQILHLLQRYMIGFAGEVSREIERRNPVRNFAYLVSALLYRIDHGDYAWLYDLPTRLNKADENWARKIAEHCANLATKAQHQLDLRELTSTLGFEALHDLVVEHGRGDMQGGLLLLTEAIQDTPRSTNRASTWHHFSEGMEAARRRRDSARRVAERARVGESVGDNRGIDDRSKERGLPNERY